ncbi:MAG: hypothetical protein EBY22_12045 [Gammaproteobacteria bacterium]|nr:hypothetical protein [Gammaproteobacteria bacterium]
MNDSATNRNWPNPSALLVGDSAVEIRIIKEFLVTKNWQVDSITNNPIQALKELEQKPIGCLLIIDSVTLPAAETLRIIFRNHKARLIPTLLHKQNISNADQLIYEQIFSVSVIESPLNQNNFSTAFIRMQTHWEQPAMTALRRVANMQESPENRMARLNILEKLTTDHHAAHFALHAMINLMLDASQHREAEKKILEAFRQQPENPSLVAICAWFYLECVMPIYALKFLQKLKAMAPGSTIFNFDIAAANIACGRISSALDALSEWNNKQPGSELIESHIGRLLAAEGRLQSADQMGISKRLINKISVLWDGTTLPPTAHLKNPSRGSKVS